MANYLAAILIVAAVALFVAAPLSGGFLRRRRSTGLELELEGLEHDRGLAVQGLRELEFDREMGKLDEADYRDLKRSLEDRALVAMTAIERARGVSRGAAMRLAARAPRPVPARPLSGSGQPVVNFCPQCGVRVGLGHKYCAGCGTDLNAAAARYMSRAE